MSIQKVAVIGSGVMGSGIAAQLANAGLEVELLDIVLPNQTDRDFLAKSALEKMVKTNPAPLMHKRNLKKIRAGNTDDHMDRVAACDLIIEVVKEDIAIKSALFKKIDGARKAGSFVTSNTSTIPLHDLTAGQSDQFKRDFMVTHFFNPPRYMPLLELITSPHNTVDRIAEITEFMDVKMGKGVVVCNDTPGFIANRIGTYWIQTAINEAHTFNLTVEEADSMMGRPIGVPKTGVFGLVDLVGLDLMPHISKSLISKLPANDAYTLGNKTYPVIDKMIADGYTGRKGKGGFYRINDKKEKLAIDLATGAARPVIKAKLAAADKAKAGGIKALVESNDKGGQYAWAVLKQLLCYTAEHAHTIAADIVAVDTAMKLGYNWKYGPFELIDKLGVDYFIARLKREGVAIPPYLAMAAGKSFYRVEQGRLQYLTQSGQYETVKRAAGVLLLSDIKRNSKPIMDNTINIPMIGKMGAAVWDIGDGVLCLEFTSKQNTLDFFNLKMINRACDLIEGSGGKYKALVVHNEGDDFSFGANIGVALLAAKLKQYWIIEKMVKMGQQTYKRVKYASFPVVSAPAGKALGGGCEILLHSHHVQAHAETYAGLVEVGVGLLPAWGGSTELICRAKQSKKLPGGPMPAVAQIFETISTAKVALSAFEARDLFIFRETDGVTMNKSRLLADAKAAALKLAANFTPEKPFDIELPGPAGLAALNLAVDGFFQKGAATSYDVVVSNRVAEVLTGGSLAGVGVKVSQDYLRELEFEKFMQLARDPRTMARIASIIKSGKPLREKAVQGLKAANLLGDANKPSLWARLMGQSSPKTIPLNDNKESKIKGLTVEAKARVNWPKL